MTDLNAAVRIDPDALVMVTVTAVRQDIDDHGNLFQNVRVILPINIGGGKEYVLTGTMRYPETPDSSLPAGGISRSMTVKFRSVEWTGTVLSDYASTLRDSQLDALKTIRKIADAIELLSREPGACHATITEVRADTDAIEANLHGITPEEK